MAYYTLNSYRLKADPFRVFQAFQNEKNCFFLDSSLNSGYPFGRYSFLGIDPFFVLETKSQDSFSRLRQFLEKYKISIPGNPLPFLGGAVGYLAYDLGFHLEKKLKKSIPVDLDIPDLRFGFYNTAIICDNFKRRLYIFTVGFPEKSYYLGKSLCESNFKKIYNMLKRHKFSGSKNNKKKPQEKEPKLKSNFSQAGYLAAVRKAKEYIRQGDIYQVNLSQRFQASSGLSASEIYGRLRKLSPSCFSAYLDCGDFQILSSSPERFLSLRGNRVNTRPMKGTRARSKIKRKDEKFKKELLDSEKDKAELLMIVDLERNDLGRVCEYDSIRVDNLRALEEYSTVFQTTSSISAKLHKDKDSIDLLHACFPGGSITGCPKIRAMEIIEELEPSRRLIYTGSLGYLSFSGNLDFNILIRTILKKQDKLYFGAGGGIVADSIPQKEYIETLVKAKAMKEAIDG